MFKLLQIVADKEEVHILLRILLSATDIFCAGILLLGGLNATVSHPLTGYICAASSILLLYLSSALWRNRRREIVIRFILYATSTLFIGGSFLLITLANRHRTLPVDFDLIALIVVLLLICTILSAVHLRKTRQAPATGPGFG